MKALIIIILIWLTIALFGCQEDAEIQPKFFPILVTKDATQIDSTGVTFNAEILDIGKEKIVDFGFKWINTESEFSYSLMKENKPDDFTMRISNDLKKDFQYSYRAYIRTSGNLILANSISFQSKGSLPPVITDLDPKEGYDGTRITITGSNFSYYPGNNHVRVNGLEADVVHSTKDSLIFILPDTHFNGAAEIMVQVGDYATIANDKFNIIGPIISSISDDEGYSGDTITIQGANFLAEDKTTELFWGSKKMIITDISASKIAAIIPPIEELLISKNENLNVFVGIKKASGSQKFTILQAWMNESNFPYALSLDYQIFSHENEAYIFDLVENNIFKIQLETNKWISISNELIPAGKHNSLCIPQNQFVYKIGGYDYKPDLTESRELWSFNIKSKEWIRLQDIPFSFTKAVYYNKNGLIHIITDKQDHWKCDFENGIFQKLNNLPVKITNPYEQPFMETFLSNNRIFLVLYGRTFEYLYETNNWVEKANYPIRAGGDSYRLKCITYNEIGFIIDFVRNEMFRYDVNADQWKLISLVPPVPDTHAVGTKFIVWSMNQKLYISGANQLNSNIYSYKNF